MSALTYTANGQNVDNIHNDILKRYWKLNMTLYKKKRWKVKACRIGW